MPEETKSSGAVTALATIGLVFGIIGLLSAFVPIVGAAAFFIGIPGAIAAFIGLLLAKSRKANQTFAIAALTVSLIGVAISGFQFISIVGLGAKAERAMKQTSNPTPKIEERKFDDSYTIKVIDPKKNKAE